jgi:hypothetical protein
MTGLVPASPSATLLGWRLIEHDAARGWVQLTDAEGQLLARATSSARLVPVPAAAR